PWAKYEDAISRLLPGFIVHSIEPQDGGYSNTALLVNGQVLFRFPKRKETWETNVREAKLLRRLRGRLSVALPNPLYETAEFWAHEYVPGNGLTRELIENFSAPDQDGLAAQLAQVITELHTTPPEFLRGIEVPQGFSREYWIRIYKAWKSFIFPDLEKNAQEPIRELFEGFLAEPENFAYQPVLIHRELWPWHILVEPGKAQLAGLIDFGCARWADPALEISSLLLSYGRDFVLKIANHYKGIAGFWPRMSFYAETYKLEWARDYFTRAGEIRCSEEEFRRAVGDG
ncbi:MAG TPA: phosphotransferase, partial [Candidatus Angelobacter sp.]|nr:phosphotransferase [Candidatus Angelobacter sp.]